MVVWLTADTTKTSAITVCDVTEPSFATTAIIAKLTAGTAFGTPGVCTVAFRLPIAFSMGVG